MSFKYENKDYVANVIHLGGQAVKVEDGVIELSEEDNNKWGRDVLSHGFILSTNESNLKEKKLQNLNPKQGE